MTIERKNLILAQIMSLLDELTSNDAQGVTPAISKEEEKAVVMLTLDECCEVAKGVSKHTIRKLCLQGKIFSIRSGEGKRGKILVSKDSLIDYFKGGEKNE